MGALSAEEMDRVAADVARYPELRAELEEISRTIEEIAPVEGMTPSAGLRGRVLDQISPRAEVIPMPPRRSYLMVASFIGMFLASGLALWFWSDLQKTNSRLADLESRANATEIAYSRAAEELSLLRDRENHVVRMSTSETETQAFAVLYWNESTRTVWIDAERMPALNEGEQYQLWAIDENGPVDAGVFDGKRDGLQKLKEVRSADQFAVTVEPEGGSSSPTLDRMTVSGAI